MTKPLFDFNKQLSVGNNGEKDFVRYYENLGPEKSTDRKIDFYLKDGSTVELKTDTYDMGKTINFFMEISGNMDTGALGGPWRALQDNITYFVYYYPVNKTFFWFRTVELCKILDDIVAKGTIVPKTIRNKGWVAIGYCIPRYELEKIQYRKDEF